MPKYEHSIADACLPIIRAAAQEGKRLTAEDITLAFPQLSAMARSRGGHLLGRAAAMARLARHDPAHCADAIRRALARDARVRREEDPNMKLVVWRFVPPGEPAAPAPAPAPRPRG